MAIFGDRETGDHPVAGTPQHHRHFAGKIDALLEWTLDVEADAVAATAIRDTLRRGERPPELADSVADKIRELGLYTD